MVNILPHSKPNDHIKSVTLSRFWLLALQASTPQRVFWDAEEERSKCWWEENLQPQCTPQRFALHTGRVFIYFLSFPSMERPTAFTYWCAPTHYSGYSSLLASFFFHPFCFHLSLVLNWFVRLQVRLTGFGPLRSRHNACLWAIQPFCVVSCCVLQTSQPTTK